MLVREGRYWSGQALLGTGWPCLATRRLFCATPGVSPALLLPLESCLIRQVEASKVMALRELKIETH